ncbi:MAG: hypothetical protein A3K18_31930 [Lentisphaerae bacterium RIFOXYA12_64_32]|nr:MAG: hypothetical protein A3K18_31930 [Lentisphaerae bacterium RIFOXYA12_64_32]
MSDYTCKVTTHGRRQLELDATYPVVSDRAKVQYQLDFYIFSPQNLGLNERRYGRKQFLQDLELYVRYTPYSIPLQKLIDPECDLSPLVRITSMLCDTCLGREIKPEGVLYELRTLVNAYHSQTRAVRNLLRELVQRGSPPELITERLDTFFGEVDTFLTRFRDLRPRFLDPRISDLLREGLDWADEGISLSTEKVTYQIYDLCASRPQFATVTAMIRDRLSWEHRYREKNGWTTLAHPATPEANESFLYRESMLKKWAQGVMYMDIPPAQLGARIAHVLAGFAAAAAMAFAVAAAFLADRLFTTYSLPWAFVIVVAYIFKDRIKEVLRSALIAYLPRVVADDERLVIDHLGGDRRVGKLRARVRFCCPRDVPDAVTRLRHVEANPFRNILPPENVIHFQSELNLDCKHLMEPHRRLESLTNILRLQLDPWFRNMDDPENDISCVVNDQRQEVAAKRTYHINIILRLCRDRAKEVGTLSRYRLVLCRDRILRVEHLESLAG